MFRSWFKNSSFRDGFTLIELVLVMGIFAILASFATVNLLGSQRQADLNSTTTSLIADFRQQQARSMLGESGGSSQAVLHGVFIQNNRYTLFSGSTYNPADPLNFVVDMPPTLSLATTFSSSTILFDVGSGEVNTFVDGVNTVTLASSSGQQKVFTFNKYGALSVN